MFENLRADELIKLSTGTNIHLWYMFIIRKDLNDKCVEIFRFHVKSTYIDSSNIHNVLLV